MAMAEEETLSGDNALTVDGIKFKKWGSSAVLDYFKKQVEEEDWTFFVRFAKVIKNCKFENLIWNMLHNILICSNSSDKKTIYNANEP